MAGTKKGTNTGAANKPPKGTTNAEGGGEAEEEEEEEEAATVTLADVNKAIDARLSRFTRKTLPKALEASFATALAKAGLTKPAEGEGEEEEEEEPEGTAGAEAPATGSGTKPHKGTAAAQQPAAPARSPSEDKKYKKLQKELAEMKAAQEAEKQKRLREEEVALLAAELPKLNVRPEMVGPLTTYLRSEDAGRLVRRSAEGKVVFAHRDEDGDEEEVSLRDGLTKWLATDAGKVYVAPKGAGGSGATNAGRPPGKNGAGGNTATELDNALFGMFSGQ